MAINFGAFAPKPGLEIASAISSALQQQPYQEAQLQAVGQQVMANVLAPAVTNRALRSDPRFIARVKAIAAQYHLPVPMIGGGDPSQQAAAPAQAGPTVPSAGGPIAAAAAPAGAATAPQTPGAAPAGGTPLKFGVPGGQQGPPTVAEQAAQQAPAGGAGGVPGSAPASAPQSVVGGTGPAANEVASAYPPADQGPLRIDVNAMLGRTLGLQDFKTLSGMTPGDRVEALRQGGYDLSEFDPKWLNEQPSLDPAQQVAMVKDVMTTITKDIADGATVDQIRLSMAAARPYLSPAQNAELDANITDTMDKALQIRQQQVVSSGLLRAGTLDLMNRKFAASQQNVDWEHNYKYTVLNDKNAQWSTEQLTRQQNADTASQRLGEEIKRDQANGLIDGQGRVLKGGGETKPGELINTANKMLDSIRSGVNEYNTRIQNAIQNPGKGGAVNPPMEADLQNQIDAYNRLVDMMNARDMHYFTHYRGPDQSAISANTARVTAGNAVNSQGQKAAQPASSIPAGAQPGTFKNGRHGYVLNGKYFYDDGTPANP